MKKNLYMQKIGKKARAASLRLANTDISKRNSALKQFNKYLKKYSQLILNENKKDISFAKSKKIKISMIERLKLSDKKIKQIQNSIKEIILATSATIEGQTTAHYIQDSLKNEKVKVSKLAQGLPVGGEIEFLDDGTLFSAFKNRGPVTND